MRPVLCDDGGSRQENQRSRKYKAAEEKRSEFHYGAPEECEQTPDIIPLAWKNASKIVFVAR
jgi:hypothetical protein